jgi:hypothetical protein
MVITGVVIKMVAKRQSRPMIDIPGWSTDCLRGAELGDLRPQLQYSSDSASRLSRPAAER